MDLNSSEQNLKKRQRDENKPTKEDVEMKDNNDWEDVEEKPRKLIKVKRNAPKQQ